MRTASDIAPDVKTELAKAKYVSGPRQYVGHYHITRIEEVEGETVVSRRIRRGAMNFDPRGIISEEPVLRLLGANGIPVPKIREFNSVRNHRFSYIDGVDLFPWTAPGVSLPEGILRQLASAWAAQIRVGSDALRPYAMNLEPGSRRLPCDSKEFHAYTVEWLVALHRQFKSSVTPLLRAIGFAVIGDSEIGSFSGDAAIWEPFRDASKKIAQRPLAVIHGDLSPKNMIFDGKTLSIIDWELAAIGDPAWDLAVFIQRSHLTPEDCATLFACIEAEGVDLDGLEEDVHRYRALELFKSIIVDCVRFQSLISEDPGRIDSATLDLASRLDILLRYWRDAQADRGAVRDFLMAKVIERRLRSGSQAGPVADLPVGPAVERRDTCALDLGRKSMTDKEALEILVKSKS